jgi:hypothetical protein
MMKKTFKTLFASIGIIAMIAIIGLGMAGCGNPAGGDTKLDPVVADFSIGSLMVSADGSPKAVSVTAKANKTTGTVTVYYEGIEGTSYPKSTTPPSAAGKYAVTFNVAAAGDYNAKNGLSAGTLVIDGGLDRDTITGPSKIIDFEDNVWGGNSYSERTVEHDGLQWTVSGVGNMDANDRHDGTRSIRLRGTSESEICGIELDYYIISGIKTVYFQYASYSSHSGGTIALYSQVKDGQWVKVGNEITVPVWGTAMLNAKFDLNIASNVRFKIVREGNVGNTTSVNIDNIIIEGPGNDRTAAINIDSTKMPKAADYDFVGFSVDYDGNPKAVTITPKENKSTGSRTIWYTGTEGTTYPRSQTAPSAVGKYAVTFDVVAASGYYAVSGLVCPGVLTIREVITDPHIIIDFEDGAWASSGYADRTVEHNGLQWTVSAVGTMDNNDHYVDTRSLRLRGTNLADNCRIELDYYITGGIKELRFDYASYSSHSGGAIVLYSQIRSGPWVKVGEEIIAPSWGGDFETAKIILNLSQDARFKIVREGGLGVSTSSVNIDNIIIIGNGTGSLQIDSTKTPQAADYDFTGLSVDYDGTAKAVTITPKEDKSTGARTIWYTGTDGTTYPRSQTAPSAVGKYTVTFDVVAATGFYAVTGLSAGILTIREVISGSFVKIDFEDAAWNGSGYANREVIANSHTWSVSAVINPDTNDRYVGTKSARFRGNATDGTANPNRVEQVTYFTSGIKSISFDYASYSTHSGGVIILSYQTQGSSSWTEAGSVTVPAWNAATGMQTTSDYAINTTQATRFKIEKTSVSGSTSVNIDNIVIKY